MDPRVKAAIEGSLDESIRDLQRLCHQPSVGAQNWGILECAQLMRDLLQEAGVSARILPTPNKGNPVVYGELKGTSSNTLIFYDHYDVQPAEPLELWETPPFEPAIRENRMYARGISDDKGHIVARLAAIKALLRVQGRLPCSVKFCIEGAEEMGSPNFVPFVEQNKQLLKADVCIWEAGGVNWEGRPTVNLGMKGILYVELEARTANRDSHSSWGTVVANPAWRLAWALSTLKDQDENLLIPGFYDDVRPPLPLEIDAISRMPDEDEELRQSLQVEGFLKGVRGKEFLRRHLLEPTCNICGIESGYTGSGTKTVLPHWAKAKIDFRLVPNQRYEDILDKLRRHLDSKRFADIKINYSDGENPGRTPIDHPWVRLVADAAMEVYGSEPVIIPTNAGSGPIHCFTDILGIPVATCGIGYPESRIHAPNENIQFDYFTKGVLHTAAVMERLGNLNKTTLTENLHH
ncbi:MAG: M20/M25/M40 family metallo-hydrolase [Chloroflexi bacterium]|nr:M20/M25/M40 family metallo-hydrolase [Chloroflexota bacterium]